MEKEKINNICFIVLLFLSACNSNNVYTNFKLNPDIKYLEKKIVDIKEGEIIYYQLKTDLSIRISSYPADSLCHYFDTTFRYSNLGSSIVMLTEKNNNQRSFKEFNRNMFNCKSFISGPEYVKGDSIRIYKKNAVIVLEHKRPKIDSQSMGDW